MSDNNLQDSNQTDESITIENSELEANQEKKEDSKGILSYSSKSTQSVISLFGFELTAPSGLKNPGIVYLGFIVVNLLLFLVLRSFISR